MIRHFKGSFIISRTIRLEKLIRKLLIFCLKTSYFVTLLSLFRIYKTSLCIVFSI